MLKANTSYYALDIISAEALWNEGRKERHNCRDYAE